MTTHVSEQSQPLALIPLVQQAFPQTGHQSRSSGYAAIGAGLLPKPVHVGRAAYLPAHEIAALISARIAGKSDAEIRLLVQRLHAMRTQKVAE